jgi:DNA-binding transcriptional LysR family regulator
MLELRHLRAFVAVVDQKGYTRAAEALGVSQSTVSESLAALERAMGAPLLRRTSRVLVPTATGERLLPLARRMLALHDEMLSAAAGAGDAANAITIGANESVATYLLPRHLAMLRDRRKGNRFQVVTGTCAEIREGIRNGTLDLGLVLEPWHEKTQNLVTTKLLVLASPRHPLASRTAAAGELAAGTFSLADVAGSFHQVIHRYFKEAGSPEPKMEAAGSVEAVKRTVIAGEHLGVLPAFAVADELAARTIAAVKVSPAMPEIALRALHPVKRRAAPAARELLELLAGS